MRWSSIHRLLLLPAFACAAGIASAQPGSGGGLWNELRDAVVTLDDGGRLTYSYDPGQREEAEARAIAIRSRGFFCSFYQGWTCPGGGAIRTLTYRSPTSTCMTVVTAEQIRTVPSPARLGITMIVDCAGERPCLRNVEFGPIDRLYLPVDGPPQLPPLPGPGVCPSHD